MFDLLLRNCLIVNGGQPPYPGSVAVKGEHVAAILTPGEDSAVTAQHEVDAGGKVLFPGIIDPHVHFHYTYNYRDNAQEYDTETASALLGGVTTAIRMHRGPGPFADHLPDEIELLDSASRIDMTMHLTLMTEDQLATFPEYCDQYGINSFKIYLAYKGKAGKLQGIEGSDDGFIYAAMRRIGQYPDGVACVHAENSEVIDRIAQDLQKDGREDFAAWTEARPSWTEGEAISRVGYIAHNAGCPLYIVHLTSAEGLAAVEYLRQRGVDIRAEVCIQHLTHTVDTELGAIAKVNPPLRYQEDVDALWDGIRRGVVDTVATDHVAHTTHKADVSLWNIMPGNPGTATMLPALLTFGYHQGKINLGQVASLVSKNTSDIFHLPGKGRIEVGADADLTLVDLELERTVDPGWLRSSSDYSLYQGMTLKGWPTHVYLRGKLAMKDGEALSQPGDGRFLLRGETYR